VSTPLDPNETYTKKNCPAEFDVKLREKVWAAHGILIHLSIWARPDLAHAVSALGRYVHNPSEKLWTSYDRIAKYLIKTKDIRIGFGSCDNRMGKGSYTRLAIRTGEDRWTIADQVYVFFLVAAAISWKVKLSPTV
jgi:hypothetical protein